MNDRAPVGDIRFFTSAQEAPGKTRILSAALALFVRDGLCETSIRDIAKAAGYTNPALYKHFAGKDELAQHLFERCYGELSARLEAAAAGQGDARGRLSEFLRAYLSVFDEHPDAVLYVHQHMQRFWPRVPETGRRRTAITVLRELVAACVEKDGTDRAEDVTLTVVAVMGALNQLVRMIYLGGLDGPASKWAAGLDRRVSRLLAA